MLPEADCHRFDAERHGKRGDFVILTDARVTRSHDYTMGAEASMPALAEVEAWSTRILAGKLSELGTGYVQYASAVHEYAIDGMTLLGLTEDDLDEIGIRSKMQRKRILASIARIKRQESLPGSAGAARRTERARGPGSSGAPT